MLSQREFNDRIEKEIRDDWIKDLQEQGKILLDLYTEKHLKPVLKAKEIHRNRQKERGPKTVRQAFFLNRALLPEHRVEVEYVRTQST